MSNLEDHEAEQEAITAAFEQGVLDGTICGSCGQMILGECPGCSFENEIVTRSAPRWAWELIDETLAMDAQSSGFDAQLREQIGLAIIALVIASEDPDLTALSRDEAKED